MSQTIQYILIAAAVIVLLLIGLKLFKATFKTIFTIVLNAVIGALAIWLLNHADRQSDQIVKAHPFGRAFFIRTLCLS